MFSAIVALFRYLIETVADNDAACLVLSEIFFTILVFSEYFLSQEIFSPLNWFQVFLKDAFILVQSSLMENPLGRLPSDEENDLYQVMQPFMRFLTL